MPKVREAIRLVEIDGWILNCTRGSHRHFKHAVKKGIVTIAGRPNRNLPPKTWKSIVKQAGLKQGVEL